mgnify:CR=1 FL=1
MTIERKEDKQKEEKPESVEDTTPQFDMSAIADLTATVSAMGKQLTDLNAAVTAIANQGSVNESIEQDNHETDEVEYPTIDIDGINRLLGV